MGSGNDVKSIVRFIKSTARNFDNSVFEGIRIRQNYVQKQGRFVLCHCRCSFKAVVGDVGHSVQPEGGGIKHSSSQ